MALKDLFKKTVSVPVEEKIDPIVEQRRREKFEKPLLYAEDDFDSSVNKMQEAIQKPASTQTASPKTQTPTQPKTSSPSQTKTVTPSKVQRPKYEAYQFTEVISPIYGKSEEKAAPKTAKQEKPKKKTPQQTFEDSVVPVISPMYGFKAVEEEEAPKEETKVTRRSRRQKTEITQPKEESVTEDLRNIASLTSESQSDLKLVEKRTGEFQFDFSKNEEPTLIDEIDDAMTLDELMSLYEKKFEGDK